MKNHRITKQNCPTIEMVILVYWLLNFFVQSLRKKIIFFFKNEQKKLGNYKNKHTIRIVGRFHGVLTRAEPNPYKNRVAE